MPIKIGPPALRPELRVSQEAKSQSCQTQLPYCAGWEQRKLSGPPFSRPMIGQLAWGALLLQLHPTHGWPIGLGALVSRKPFTTIFLWACAGDALILCTVHSVPGSRSRSFSQHINHMQALLISINRNLHACRAAGLRRRFKN